MTKYFKATFFICVLLLSGTSYSQAQSIDLEQLKKEIMKELEEKVTQKVTANLKKKLKKELREEVEQEIRQEVLAEINNNKNQQVLSSEEPVPVVAQNENETKYFGPIPYKAKNKTLNKLLPDISVIGNFTGSYFSQDPVGLSRTRPESNRLHPSRNRNCFPISH